MTNEDEIRKMKTEIRQLKVEIDGLKSFIQNESNNLTKHILIIQKHVSKLQSFATSIQIDLADAFYYIWPMVAKVLPDFVRDKKRIDELTRGKKR